MMRSACAAMLCAASLITAIRPAEADIRCWNDGMGRQICEVGISSMSAQRASKPQNMTQWCWAACISMIFDYHGHPVSQARIVQQAYGGIVDMPAGPDRILRALNRRWVDDYGRAFIARADIFSVTAATVTSDLQYNHPLIIGTLGHAVVLTAITYYPTYNGPYIVGAIVRDPWPTRPSRRQVTPSEWASISFAARVRVLE